MDPKFRKYIVIGLVVFVVFVVAALVLRALAPNPYRVYNLGISYSDQAHTQLDGSTLQLFNGAGFFTLDLASDEPAKLLGGAGQRIPNPSSIIWAGDRGVLLSFNRSYINTPVYDIAARQGISQFDIDQTTWWYDFSNSSFSLVAKQPIYNNVGVYDESSNSIYFVAEADVLTARRYDIAKEKTTTIGPETSFSDPQFMQGCDSSICVVGVSPQKPGVQAVWKYSRNSDSFAPIYENDAPILSTGKKGIYFTYKNNQSAQTDGQIASYADFSVVNTINKTEQTFSYTLGLDSVGVYAQDDKNLAFFGDTESSYSYISNKLFGPSLESLELTLEGGQYDEGVLADFQTYNGGVIFGSFEGNTMLFTNKNNLDAPIQAEPDKVIQTLNDCSLRVEYIEPIETFTITATDSKVVSEFKKAGECFDKSPEILYANTYIYQTVSDVNGRVTSD